MDYILELLGTFWYRHKDNIYPPVGLKRGGRTGWVLSSNDKNEIAEYYTTGSNGSLYKCNDGTYFALLDGKIYERLDCEMKQI